MAKKISRSSKTGKFVKKSYTDKHKKTTQTETVSISFEANVKPFIAKAKKFQKAVNTFIKSIEGI